jgi:uncharacterized Ntn-hydrolase superfamily protein
MTTEQLDSLPTGAKTEDSDGEVWQKDQQGEWRQVGVFGLLGQSAFSSAHYRQGMGPITTWQI